jgi:protein-tyrosine phosphatase
VSGESAAAGPVRICFVCLGNICRSPTAAGVMRYRAAREGVADRLVIESAGTSDWHVGSPADPRSAAELARRGVPLEHSARQFTAADFGRFDLVLAMDDANVAALRAIAPDGEARGRIRLLRAFDPASDPDDPPHVPDPYYGGADGFSAVFDMVDAACAGLVDHLRRSGRL